jgi:hypothetical protein
MGMKSMWRSKKKPENILFWDSQLSETELDSAIEIYKVWSE